MDTIIKKFNRSRFRLIVLIIICLTAGVQLLFYPELTSIYVIRLLGFLWIIEGFSYTLELYNKHLKSKIKNGNKEN